MWFELRRAHEYFFLLLINKLHPTIHNIEDLSVFYVLQKINSTCRTNILNVANYFALQCLARVVIFHRMFFLAFVVRERGMLSCVAWMLVTYGTIANKTRTTPVKIADCRFNKGVSHSAETRMNCLLKGSNE